MQLNGILDQFPLPQVAVDDLRRMNLQSQGVGEEGVSMFMAGHDQGISYRFFQHTEYNREKSRLAGYEVSDVYDMIEWNVEKRTKPTEKVHFLPSELLSFEIDEEYDAKGNCIKRTYGECLGGKYKDSYDRYKNGLSTPGLPLNKWGVLDDAEVANLAKHGIFSVEQFAATPRSKIEGKFSPIVADALQRAGQYVNGKENRDLADKTAATLLSMQQEMSRLRDELAAAKEGAKPKSKGGRPKKVKVTDGKIQIEGENED